MLFLVVVIPFQLIVVLLSIQLEISWQIRVDKNSPPEEQAKLFVVTENYVTFLLGSKIRDMVSTVTFPRFNAKWFSIIQEALFADNNEYPTTKLAKI